MDGDICSNMHTQDRTILHCDMNSFFASVELLEHPELRSRPVAVCGDPKNRHGIILAKNEPAKKYGIVTAETVWQAKRKCPNLVLLPPHHEKYRRYCTLLNEIYARYTDRVEPFSIDESWLDVTESLSLFGSGRAIADDIRKTVKGELGLTLSAGVSFNKIFAKMGSEYKKPDATTVITRENFRELLWPLPIGELFFVGRATAEKLCGIGITTIGDAARCDRKSLLSLLGKQGEQVYIYANGLDTSPVCRASERQKIKSVGNGTTFRRNLSGLADIRTAVTALSDKVAGRLRKYGMKAGGIKVDIKDPNLSVISRQKQLTVPTNLTSEISAAAMEIIRAAWGMTKPVRMLTITGINLCDGNEAVQLSIFDMNDESREKSLKLESTMDAIRAKFGEGSISFGSIINNDIGVGPGKGSEAEPDGLELTDFSEE